MKKIVILISGRGSNMEALIKAQQTQKLGNAKIAAIISNRPDAVGLITAKNNGIATNCIDHTLYSDRDHFDAALIQIIDQYQPDLVILAGFMRILTARFVNHYALRLINIHPSLLPAFPGLNTHRQALESGCRIHGCTVHFVTEQLDHGPIIIQAAVPVYANDNETSLAARVLAEEHRIYPLAVRWFVDDQLLIQNQRVMMSQESVTPGASALVSPVDSLNLL